MTKRPREKWTIKKWLYQDHTREQQETANTPRRPWQNRILSEDSADRLNTSLVPRTKSFPGRDMERGGRGMKKNGSNSIIETNSIIVALSVMSVRRVHPMEKQTTMLHRNLRGAIKIRDQPINTRNLFSVHYQQNIIKIIATICHITF